MTDKLRSYGVARRESMPEVIHDSAQYANNRAEQSNEVTRVGERGMRKFKSTRQGQRFVTAHAAVVNLFNLGRALAVGIWLEQIIIGISGQVRLKNGRGRLREASNSKLFRLWFLTCHCLDLRWVISCCFKSRFTAITVRHAQAHHLQISFQSQRRFRKKPSTLLNVL